MTSDLDPPPAATPTVNAWARRSLRWGLVAAFLAAFGTAAFALAIIMDRQDAVILIGVVSVPVLAVGAVIGLAALLAAIVGGIQLVFVTANEPGMTRAVTGGVIGLLACLWVGVGILPALSSPPEPRWIPSCPNNLKQLGLVCRMYAAEAPGEFWPPLAPDPGRLMFPAEPRCGGLAIYNEYLTDASAMTCPDNQQWIEEHRTQLEADPRIAVDDQSYFYLGYVLSNDDQVQAFAEVYRQQIQRGGSFCEHLPAPPGRGSFGGDVFLRLKKKVEEKGAPDSDDPAVLSMIMSRIPVMVERPIRHGRSHAASNVLYLDGHVESIKYPGKWPVTEATINTLLELDRLGGR